MKWEKVKLGDICKYVTSGGTPKSSIKEYYEPKQIPWLKTKEVNYCRIYETESYISKDGLDNSSAKMIPQNSVIVAMYGQGDTAGRVAINKIPLTTNQACCNLIIDETKAYYEFVYYQLVTLYEKMVSLKNGGAQPNLNAAIIKSIEIKLPPLKTQRYIADILSSYDNLIENNQKQIKLLEEVAQRLYKEWFVDLRFPGHENTKIVDGVPEGWIKEEIGKIIKKVHRTKQIVASEYKDEGSIPIVDQSRAFVAGYTNDLEARVDFGIPIIVFGDHTRIVKLIQFPFAKGADGTQLIISDCLEMPQRLLYCSIMNVDLSNYHYARHFKYLKEEKIMIPTVKVANEFENNVTGIFSKIQNCRDEIIRCQKTRDLLLPKLMSGEVEV